LAALTSLISLTADEQQVKNPPVAWAEPVPKVQAPATSDRRIISKTEPKNYRALSELTIINIVPG